MKYISMHASYGCRSSSPLLTPHGVLHKHHLKPNTTFRCPSRAVPSSSKPFRRRRRMDKTVLVSAHLSPSSVTDFDLYDLLGVDRSSDQSEIKNAYRALQKRCHPDIAGAAGHDMAIVLNEAYSLLSNPISRSSYDAEHAKMLEFRGYTGKPLYSTWLGGESEERAVFVDEVRCVGCLKCALFASNTFAVETTYGRARVTKQWADPEHQIRDAMHACPVDCISFVERSDLAALEFLMSKQPRGDVRMTGINGGGARVANIFHEIKKFQKKFEEIEKKASKKKGGVEEYDLQSDMRVSAVHAIRSVANWLRWGSPVTPGRPTSSEAERRLLLPPGKDVNRRGPNLDKLREATAKMRDEDGKVGFANRKLRGFDHSSDDEYWTPMLVLPEPSGGRFDDGRVGDSKGRRDLEGRMGKEAEVKQRSPKLGKEEEPMGMGIPMVVGMVSAAVVGYGGGQQIGVGLEEHVGGRMALQVVNSFELQVVLAGITWYLCGAAIIGFVKVIGKRLDS